jgi:hypothetical protein
MIRPEWMGLALVVFALVVFAATPGLAQGWTEPAAPQYRQAGIVAARIQQDEANATAVMIRCVAGEIQLIVAGTGGDPPSGAGTISAGNVRVRTQFTPDADLQGAIGVAGSRAMVPADLLGEMARARSLSVTTTTRFGNGQIRSQTRNTSLNGFARLMPVLRQECMGDVRQAARTAPPPKPQQDDIADVLPPETGPPRTAEQLPAAARNALNDYAQRCTQMGDRAGGFAGKGVYIADLNGDGVPDYVYFLRDYSCPGGPSGGGHCEASGGCDVDVIMSFPGGHRMVQSWRGVRDVSIGKDGSTEYVETISRMDGRIFVTRSRWAGSKFETIPYTNLPNWD